MLATFPLNLGLITNAPEDMIPMGGSPDMDGFYPHNSFLKIRPAYKTQFTGVQDDNANLGTAIEGDILPSLNVFRTNDGFNLLLSIKDTTGFKGHTYTFNSTFANEWVEIDMFEEIYKLL